MVLWEGALPGDKVSVMRVEGSDREVVSCLAWIRSLVITTLVMVLAR